MYMYFIMLHLLRFIGGLHNSVNANRNRVTRSKGSNLPVSKGAKSSHKCMFPQCYLVARWASSIGHANMVFVFLFCHFIYFKLFFEHLKKNFVSNEVWETRWSFQKKQTNRKETMGERFQHKAVKKLYFHALPSSGRRGVETLCRNTLGQWSTKSQIPETGSAVSKNCRKAFMIKTISIYMLGIIIGP